MENTMYGETKTKTIILCASEQEESRFQYLIEMENCGSVRLTVLYVKCFDLLDKAGQRTAGSSGISG